MKTEATAPVSYYLTFNQDFLVMNQIIGKRISLSHEGYECFNCGLDKPIKGSGYCSDCYFQVPQTQESVIRPEKSKAHLGIEERDLAWEQKYQLQPHYVYLANTSGLKVGVTRKEQIPTRWIDQGAVEALVIAQTENRYEAGMIEVALSQHIADKTDFRKMLTSHPKEIDLVEKNHELEAYFPQGFENFFLANGDHMKIHYPLEVYPSKVKTLKLGRDKIENLELKGIKGQYLIFEGGLVLNVRAHEAYVVTLNIQ